MSMSSLRGSQSSMRNLANLSSVASKSFPISAKILSFLSSAEKTKDLLWSDAQVPPRSCLHVVDEQTEADLLLDSAWTHF